MRRVSVLENEKMRAQRPDQKQKIAAEHLEVRRENPNPSLNVDVTDNDEMHMDEHMKLMGKETLTPQATSAMSRHVDEHRINAEEKQTLGIVIPDYEDDMSREGSVHQAPLVQLTTTGYNS